jgi:hypothetical protein
VQGQPGAPSRGFYAESAQFCGVATFPVKRPEGTSDGWVNVSFQNFLDTKFLVHGGNQCVDNIETETTDEFDYT